MAGASTLDFLGRNDFSRQARADAAAAVDEGIDAEAQMLEIMAVAATKSKNGEFNEARALQQRTDNMALLLQMKSSGVVLDQESADREAAERQRDRQRKDAELEEFKEAKKTSSQGSAFLDEDATRRAAQKLEKRKLPSFLRVGGSRGAAADSGAEAQTLAEEAPPPAAKRRCAGAEDAAAGAAEAGAAPPAAEVVAAAPRGAAAEPPGGIGLGAYDSDSSAESDA